MARRIHENEYWFMFARAQAVPILATLAGSSLALLPIVANIGMMPPFGYLMLLSWRLLRPEIWPAWIALPLGLFDDLVTGMPTGSAVFLWTVTLLLLDIVDTRLLWRDFWIDWLIAGMAAILYIAHMILLSGLHSQEPALLAAIPQMLLSILSFPAVVRLCAWLDRLRLPT